MYRPKWYRAILKGNAPTPVRILCASCNWRRHLSTRTGRFPNATHVRLRREVVAKLGSQCAGCDCHEPDLLHIDHVSGGGSVERRSIRNRCEYYRRMLVAPRGALQLLCPNCNWIKKNSEEAEQSGLSSRLRHRAA